MEIKIPKEVRDYHENIFFGLNTRQFICYSRMSAPKKLAGCASWALRRLRLVAFSPTTA